MTAQSTARSVRSVPPSARAVGLAHSARDRAATWRQLRHLPPYPVSRPLRELWRLLGVKKLAATAVILIGVMRRARRQGYAGVQLTVEQWAKKAGCTERTVQRNLRILERLRLFKRIEQYVNEDWIDAGGRRRERRQVATVFVFGEVGRFTCDTKPPQPATRRAFRELARPDQSRQNVTPTAAEKVSSKPSLQSVPAAPTRAPGRKESPPATSVPPACRPAQSNTPATPAAAAGELGAPARPGAAFGVGEGAPAKGPPESAAPPLARWLELCPAFAASTERDGPPPAAPPGAADRAGRGES